MLAHAVPDEHGGLTADRPALAAGRDDDAHQRSRRERRAQATPTRAPWIGLGASRQPDALAVGLHRLHVRAAGSRIALDLTGSPVVEELGNVQDGARPLADPERNVPLRRAAERSGEAADLLQQRPAEEAETARVRLAPEPLRRKVGLEEGARTTSLRVDLVLVGVDEVGLRGQPKCAVDGRQRLPIEPIGIPEQAHKVAAGHPQSLRYRCCTTFVALTDPDARVLARGSIQPLANPRTRAIVDAETKLPLREVLPPHRSEHFLEHRRRWIGDRPDNREPGLGHALPDGRGSLHGTGKAIVAVA